MQQRARARVLCARFNGIIGFREKPLTLIDKKKHTQTQA